MTKATVTQVNLRNLVLEMLVQTEQGAKSHVVLKDTLDRQRGLNKQQRSFVTRLYQGTLERRIELDYIINQFSKTPVGKMKPVIRNILRLSVYQLKYMESVPVSAICNEAVKLAAKRKFVNLKGFVNGVLRNIARGIEDISYPAEEVSRLSVIYSVPEWMVVRWMQQYDRERTIEMLESLYREQPTTVRCNTSKATVKDITASLEYQGVEVTPSPLYENALFLKGFDRLSDLQVFQAGMITVQNLSSMMAGLAAAPKKGDYIIDVCAAPGGKSLHMAEMLAGTGCVDARDLTEKKVQLIQENITRIGCENMITKVMDATKMDAASVEKADIVMADLPCSGLGVMGNKSDIKYNSSEQGIAELVKLQRQILQVVSSYVKPGGRLIFSTCTVCKEENEENVRWIEEHLPLKRQPLTDVLPKELGGADGYVQIYPGQYGMDGFFISAFTKKKE